MANYSSDSDLRRYENLDPLKARTRLNGGITSDVTTITVDSVEPFLDTGTLLIESEQVSYTGINRTDRSFTGCTRGANSTTNVIHSDNAYVERVSLSDYHTEAKRIIDEDQLIPLGIDVNWQYENKPKLLNVSRLKTASCMLTLAMVCRAASRDLGDVWGEKAEYYQRMYDKAITSFRPEQYWVDKSTAVWVYTGGQFVDVTHNAVSAEGTDPLALMNAASDYIVVGQDDTFSQISVLMETVGSYGTLAGTYSKADGSFGSVTINDDTDGLTNVRDTQSIGWSLASDWAPISLTGGVDSRSRYWFKLSADSVTTQGKAQLFCTQEAVPYLETLGGDGLMGVGA